MTDLVFLILNVGIKGCVLGVGVNATQTLQLNAVSLPGENPAQPSRASADLSPTQLSPIFLASPLVGLQAVSSLTMCLRGREVKEGTSVSVS